MASILKGRVLGKGSYGTVYLAESIDGTLIPSIAIKSCLLQKSVSLHLEERSLIRLHGCPGIVQCFGSCLSFENGAVFYNLLLEYAARGSLWDLIQNGPTLCERDVQRYTGMILRGLTSMHLSGMVHCDLKPSNILVFPEGFKHDQLKIADFGLVKEVGFLNECEDHWKFRFRGTPDYMSPESVARGQIGPALDVWSLGCIVVEMLTGKPAWWPRCQDIETLMYRLARLKESPKIPENLSEDGEDFLRKCFAINPCERWTARRLLNHPFVLDVVGVIDPSHCSLPLLLQLTSHSDGFPPRHKLKDSL